jgi:hypothetical protein
MQRPVIRLNYALPYGLAFAMEAKVECTSLGHDLPQGGLEYLEIQIAVNLQVLTYVVDRTFLVNLLVPPDTKLSCRQLPLVVLGY